MALNWNQMEKLQSWVIVNSITFMSGTYIGLVLGKIVAELFFVFIFPFSIVVLMGQFYVLRDVDWVKQWVVNSGIGFLLGSILALIQIFALVGRINLVTNHLIALFLIGGITLIFQYRVISSQIGGDIASKWVIFTFLGLGIGSVIVGILDSIIGLALENLVIAFTDYTTTLPWLITGLIYGLTYSGLTSRLISDFAGNKN